MGLHNLLLVSTKVYDSVGRVFLRLSIVVAGKERGLSGNFQGGMYYIQLRIQLWYLSNGSRGLVHSMRVLTLTVMVQ